jgi:hypothetical protein
MSLSPTFPSLYKYGFATSRAADLLSKGNPADIKPQQRREVFSACKDLVGKIIQGEVFLMGNPSEVSNLRPEDLEIFTFVLDTDSVTKDLVAAAQESKLHDYFREIEETLASLMDDPPRVDEDKLARTQKFVTTIADSLIESARQSLRRRQAEEPSPAFHE